MEDNVQSITIAPTQLQTSAVNFNMASRCDLDLGKLVFQEATHEQKIQSWRNNSDSWAGKMTVDQYIGQQARNGNRTITRNGGIRYWVLTSADGEEVYCSGETVRKPLAALVPSRNGSSSASENRQFFRQGSWGVGGVFTPVRYRRRGLTSMLMRCIREWIDSQAATSAMSTFSALWSAVGVCMKTPNGTWGFHTCNHEL